MSAKKKPVSRKSAKKATKSLPKKAAATKKKSPPVKQPGILRPIDTDGERIVMTINYDLKAAPGKEWSVIRRGVRPDQSDPIGIPHYEDGVDDAGDARACVTRIVWRVGEKSKGYLRFHKKTKPVADFGPTDGVLYSTRRRNDKVAVTKVTNKWERPANMEPGSAAPPAKYTLYFEVDKDLNGKWTDAACDPAIENWGRD